jgi:hypothetical protein
MRSAIHDMANTLSGIRGILELSDPSVPLSRRDRSRLEAILDEGMGVLERGRHLAMGTVPEAQSEPGADWRRRLEAMLQPLSVIFRCSFEIRFEGISEHDHWPGDLLRGYALSLTRQLLPYMDGNVLKVVCTADQAQLGLQWHPISAFPESLQGEQEARPRDICARWVARAGEAVGAKLICSEDTVQVQVPRR